MPVRGIVIAVTLVVVVAGVVAYRAIAGDARTPAFQAFAEPVDVEEKRTVFISGHSLTNRPMPDMLAGIAESAGMPISWNMQYLAGSSIRARSIGVDGQPAGSGFSAGTDPDGQALDVLEELRKPSMPAGRPYDLLLITEQHRLLDVLRWNDTAGALRAYQDAFIAANAQGKSYFTTPWLDLSDRGDPADWIAYERSAWLVWQCVVATVNKTLADDGRADRIHLVPASLALAELVAYLHASPGEPGFEGLHGERLIDTLFTDRVHLTPLGNYFIAAVTFSAIYGKPVAGPIPSTIDRSRAEALAEFAERFVSTYSRQSPRFGGECASRIPLSFAAHYSSYVERTYLREERGYWGGKLAAARNLLRFAWLPVLR